MHPFLHSSVFMFCSFVHCIANFPCTLLHVAIVLNIIFLFATARVILVHVHSFVLSNAQVFWTISSTSCLHYVAGGGGYFIVVLIHVHSNNPLMYAVAWLKKKLMRIGSLTLKYSFHPCIPSMVGL